MSGRQSNPGRDRSGRTCERRRHVRIPVDLPARFRLLDHEDGGLARVVSIGDGGARVDLPVPVGLPGDIELTIELPDRSTLDLSGELTWTLTERAAGPYPTGVRFTDLSAAAQEGLNELIDSLRR